MIPCAGITSHRSILITADGPNVFTRRSLTFVRPCSIPQCDINDGAGSSRGCTTDVAAEMRFGTNVFCLVLPTLIYLGRGGWQRILLPDLTCIMPQVYIKMTR